MSNKGLVELYVAKSESEYQDSKKFEVLTQLLSQKKELVQAVQYTFLYELLLGMEYLVGSINGVTLTRDPFDYTPYLFKDALKFKGPGINEVLGVELTSEDLYWWNTFYLDIPILDAEIFKISGIKKYNHLQTYVLIRIIPEIKPSPQIPEGKSKQIRFLIFGIYNDTSASKEVKKIIGSETVLKILKESPQIKKVTNLMDKIKKNKEASGVEKVGINIDSNNQTNQTNQTNQN